ncbi:MAG TPA: FAD-binding protein [Jatrophihabitantaceae bacterium]|jgi:FAD/FMN-containing dehydrogenase
MLQHTDALELLSPGQDGYHQSATTPFAAGSPDLIARPRTATDVAAALDRARADGLTVAIRSGGHSMAGHSTHAHGLVVDLRNINHVDVPDPAARLVHVGAGATWGAVARTLHQHGLGVTAGDTNDVGVGGLTLGGGMGWMVRRYGLAIDSVVGADVVTADGTLLHADDEHDPELFWALRGGGGNFGVVVGLDFVAQPVTSVHYGTIRYELRDVAQLLTGWRDLMRDADQNLTTMLTLTPPVFGQPGAAILQCCYAYPDPNTADRALAPFRRLGTITHDDVRVLPYRDILQDANLPPGMRFVVRNTLTPALSDELIDAVAAETAAQRTMLTLRSLGGAMADVPADATAFAHRDAEAMLVALTPLPADARAEQVDEALARWAPIAAHGTGVYVNFLSSDSPADTAKAYPDATYRRLVAVKRRYDPDNVFHRNHNIAPNRGRGGAGLL